MRIFLADGAIAEVAMKERGAVYLLPQYVLADDRLQGQCGDGAEMRKFNEELSSLLALEAVAVVTKSATKGRPQYAIVKYRWTGKQYEVDGREAKLSAPKPCIWRDIESDTKSADPYSRIFRRPEGQIVIRLNAALPDAEFLSLLRRNLGEMHAAVDQAGPGSLVAGAPVGVRMHMNIGLRERVMAKIGVNLTVRVFGADYVRHACFDKIKASILAGEPEVISTLHRLDEMPPDAFLVRLFATAPANHHFCVLTAMHIPGGGMELLFCIQLYGGLVTMLRLAQDIPMPLPALPVFLFVDYVNHRVQLADAFEFTTTYMFPNLALRGTAGIKPVMGHKPKSNKELC